MDIDSVYIQKTNTWVTDSGFTENTWNMYLKRVFEKVVRFQF